MEHAVDLFAGGASGAVGIAATQPMDTVRIRLQESSAVQQQGGSRIWSCISSTVRKEGVLGLYKGVASPMLTVSVMNAMLFFTYEGVISRLNPTKLEEPALPAVYASGCAAGFASALINAPTELIKCIAQVNTSSVGGPREEYRILRDMIRTHGLTGKHGPTRGLGLTMVRDTPSTGLYFLVYESICRSFPHNDTAAFLAGGFAGASAWASIYPLDVIKTRWQTAAPGTYRSLPDCFRQSVASHGMSVLTRGFGATMLRAWPQHAVVFATYGQVRAMCS